MQISEIKCTIDKSGDLIIPKAALQEMGLFPGDQVYVAYLTQDGLQNTFREFLLSSNSMDEFPGEQQFQVPSQFLEESNIPADADLQILCLDGCIVICQDAALTPDELAAVLERLQAAGELTSSLSGDAAQIRTQLEDFMHQFQEGVDTDDV